MSLEQVGSLYESCKYTAGELSVPTGFLAIIMTTIYMPIWPIYKDIWHSSTDIPMQVKDNTVEYLE